MSLGGIVTALSAGAGVLLIAAVFLWPRRADRADGASRGRFSEMLRDRLAASGSSGIAPGVFVVTSAVLGLCVGSALHLFVPVPALSIVAGLAACGLPFVIVSTRARSMRRAERAVWPDVVDHLISAARAGVPLPDGLRALGSTGPARVRSAFAEFGADYDATADFRHAIDRVKERLGDATADRIIETLRMAREIGGTDLVSVLRSLSTHLRREASIRAEVEARQSWIVNAARVGAAAPWVVLLLLSLRPEAVSAYGTETGAVLILAGAVVTVVAYRLMLAAARLPEERRWFR